MSAEHQNGDSHNELDIPGDLTYELARGVYVHPTRILSHTFVSHALLSVYGTIYFNYQRIHFTIMYYIFEFFCSSGIFKSIIQCLILLFFSEIMQAMVDSLSEPENVKMLKEIRDDCKNDALRVMVYVYPQVVSIKIKAVEKYGIHGAQGLLKNQSKTEFLYVCIDNNFLNPQVSYASLPTSKK